MDIGGIYFEYQVASPVLIYETLSAPLDGSRVGSVLGLLANSLVVLQQPITESNDPDFILQTASIHLKPEGVTVNMNYKTSLAGAFFPVKNDTATVDYDARVAKWYDSNIVLSTAHFTQTFALTDFSVNISAVVEPVYLIGAGQFPVFAIHGYEVTGNFTAILSPDGYASMLQNTNDSYLVRPQTPGEFSAIVPLTAQQYNQITISVGNTTNAESIGFGRAMVAGKITRSLAPNQLTTMQCEFRSFVNNSSPFAYSILK